MSAAAAKRPTTAGRPVECRAAISWKAGADFVVDTVQVDVPKKGEVRVRLERTGVCHTDAFTASGADPEGIFPSILGHEGSGYVESVGEGVTSVKPGDFVIPLYIPECGSCKFCTSGRTNLCITLRAMQGKGLMPDGTSRFRAADGTALHHYMGTSTFSHYTVLPEIALAKVNRRADPEHAALLGCGVTTGIGAVQNTLKVRPGSSIAVFGLGGVGLAAVQGAALNKAGMIIAVDLNPAKFDLARRFGATHCVNPADHPDRPIQDVIVEMTDGGADYSVEAVGNVDLMRAALECTTRGWGESCIIGVAGAGQEIRTRPFQLVTGRAWRGTAFGGVKGRSQLPGMVDQAMRGEIDVAPFVTHRMPLEDINEAFRLMHEGKSIRTVLSFD